MKRDVGRTIARVIATLCLIVSVDLLFENSNLAKMFQLPYQVGDIDGNGQYWRETKQVPANEPEIQGNIVVDETESGELSGQEQEINDALLEKYRNSFDTCYSYQMLSEEERLEYVILFHTMLDYEEIADVPILDTDVLGKVFQCVLNDHPEIFYVTGYTYTRHMQNDVLKRLSIEPTYTLSIEDKEMLEAENERVAWEWISDIPAEASDYEKVKLIYERIIRNTDYDLNAPDNQNICSVLLYHQSVCQGYAKTMQYLLGKLAVESTLVQGYVNSGEGHSWLIVKMDGNYYHVDPTWGDTSYQFDNEESRANFGNVELINYDYLGVTTQDIVKNHTIDNVVALPICISDTCNYYIHEGLYLRGSSDEEIDSVLSLLDISSSKAGTFKCADAYVYWDVYGKLIEKQKIFEFIPYIRGTIGYVQNDTQYTLSIWLDE